MMPRQPWLIPIATLLLGALLLLLGLLAAGSYFATVHDALGRPDRSGMFWMLPLLFLGAGAIAAGALLIAVGGAAARGSVPARRLAILGLLVVPLAAAVLLAGLLPGERRAERMRHERAERLALIEALRRDMHRIDRLTLVASGRDGFEVRLATTGGIAGAYRAEIAVENRQAVFLEDTRSVAPEASARTYRWEIPFRRLFRKCFDELAGSGVYVCIPNSGTANSRFTVRATLALVRDRAGRAEAIEGSRPALESRAQAGFGIDTFTGPDAVRVEAFEVVRSP